MAGHHPRLCCWRNSEAGPKAIHLTCNENLPNPTKCLPARIRDCINCTVCIRHLRDSERSKPKFATELATEHQAKDPHHRKLDRLVIQSSSFFFLLPPSYQVAEGMDFKGKPARNVALVNATIDRIPFLKVWLGAWLVQRARSEFNHDVSGGSGTHEQISVVPPDAVARILVQSVRCKTLSVCLRLPTFGELNQLSLALHAKWLLECTSRSSMKYRRIPHGESLGA